MNAPIDQVALLGRALEPLVHGRRILRKGGYRPPLQQRCEIGLGLQIAGLGRLLEPSRCLVRIPDDASAGEVEHAEPPRSGFLSALGRGAEPMRRLGIVRR